MINTKKLIDIAKTVPLVAIVGLGGIEVIDLAISYGQAISISSSLQGYFGTSNGGAIGGAIGASFTFLIGLGTIKYSFVSTRATYKHFSEKTK